MTATRTSPSALLEAQLCFALYSASRATTAAYAEVLDEHGLTYPQYLVLLALWEHDGATVGELTARLRLTTATLSPLLARMQTAGLVRRKRSTSDSRVVHVHLTDAGRALRPVVEQAQHCLAAKATLTPDEMVQLRDLAARLAGIIPTEPTTQEKS